MPVVAVALVAAVILGTPPPAPAADNITVFVSLDGGLTYGSASSSTGIVHLDLTGAGFSLTVTGTSNKDDGGTQSQISQISTTFRATSAIALPNVIVALSDKDFSQVTGTALLSSSVSGTSGVIGVGTALSTFQSTMANSNKLFAGLTSPGLNTPVVGAVDVKYGVGVEGGAATATVNNPPVIISTLLSGTQKIDGSTAEVVTSATPLYSLSNQLDIIGITLGAGAQLNLTGTTTLSTVPAPAGVVLALTGLPILGLGHWLRRRKNPVKLA